MNRIKTFIDLPFKAHLIIGIVIRTLLIIYGNYHDRNYDVPYTDVDYKVFTDAARYVTHGGSPYRRHTYRYSPIIAYLMIPNVVFNRNFGKFLFSIFDIMIAVTVKSMVYRELGTNNSLKVAVYCSLFWLYNPLSIAISTRGNADSLPCFLIILSILFLQENIFKGLFKYIMSGLFLALSIHLRLYPLVFSFPMYLSLGEYKIKRNTKLRDWMISLIPNKQQIILVSSCVLTLFIITYGFYLLYEYEFLFETYIYHLIRKDTRHNFSVLFYYAYLTGDQLSFDTVKFISQIMEFIVLFVLSLSFGCDSNTLPFALFSQAVILVSFNSVMTSQYFVWFLSLLPLVVHKFDIIPAKALILAIIWIAAQGAWLFYAYLLEFKCREVFIFVWLKSIVFFCTNIYVLAQLIICYKPKSAFCKSVNSF